MKKILIILGILVILLVAAAVTAPFLVSPETYKSEVTRLVKEKTGRDLVIAGEVHASVYPALGVRMEKAALSNAPGFSAAPMAELEGLTAEVALLPLLHGQVEVKRFILEKPVILLETDAKGRPNWEFAPASQSPAPAKKQQAAKPVSDPLAALQRLSLGEIRIEDAKLVYVDQRVKTRQEISQLNLEISLKRYDAPLALKGDVAWNGEQVKFTGRVETPKKLLAGEEASLAFTVKSAPLSLDYAGRANREMARGALTLSVPSLPALAKWAGGGFEWSGQGGLALSVAGELACTGARCALEESQIALDNVKVTGGLGVDFSGAVPLLAANLSAGALDLTPFLPPGQAKQSSLLISPAYAAEGWNNSPIDVSALKKFNADISLAAEALKLRNLNLGKTTLAVRVSGGTLKLDVPQAALYGGSGKGGLSLTAANALAAQLSLSGVQAAPLLKDLTGDDRLSGSAEFNLNVSGTAISQRKLIESFSGQGKARFTDGSYKGINIPQMLRNAKSLLSGGDAAAQKTDFSELSGSFTIAQGIVKNDDLAMKAPVLRLTGQGTVDLPQMMIRYRLLPQLVGTLAGQGGEDKQGLAIPILVEGPLSNPSYRLDAESLAKEALQDPEKLKATVKDAKEQLKDVKNELKGGDLKELGNDPGKVKDLLDGFKGF